MIIMKKIIHALISIFALLSMCSCSSFLDVTPNKSGSAYIYHMDQLVEITGSPTLYMSTSASAIAPSKITNGVAYFTDAIEISPEFYAYGNNYSGVSFYKIYCMDEYEWLEGTQGSSILTATWTPSYDRIFKFNTILENIDKVEQTTQTAHDQVAGEAYFGRAYYHFLLLVEFTLWDEHELGIGYRTDTNPKAIPDRETVGYTLEHIYEDLNKAEEYLTKAGRDIFDVEDNFRPQVAAVKAFRARVDLYRGNYESALKNADDALKAHNLLFDFKNDATYKLVNRFTYSLLNENNDAVDNTMKSYYPKGMQDYKSEAIVRNKELYLRSCAISSEYFVPVSEKYYNLFDRDNDARWIYFYSDMAPIMNSSKIAQTVKIGGNSVSRCINWETQQWLKPNYFHSFFRYKESGENANILGMTTAEMYLIKAECLARSGKTTEAAEILKTLRASRFTDSEAANNIGGSIQDVLDERSREMTPFWRFYDIKRLNGAEKAGISITREILTDYTDINSRKTITIAPDDARWAFPIYKQELEKMNWEQNKGWGE